MFSLDKNRKKDVSGKKISGKIVPTILAGGGEHIHVTPKDNYLTLQTYEEQTRCFPFIFICRDIY